LLYKEIYVTLDTVLEPQKQFRLSVANVRSLSGTVRSPARTFTTPRAPKPDSTRDSTKRDSAAARPADPRPAAPRDTLAQAMRSRVRSLFGGS
jgi:hypothetical protein